MLRLKRGNDKIKVAERTRKKGNTQKANSAENSSDVSSNFEGQKFF